MVSLTPTQKSKLHAWALNKLCEREQKTAPELRKAWGGLNLSRMASIMANRTLGESAAKDYLFDAYRREATLRALEAEKTKAPPPPPRPKFKAKPKTKHGPVTRINPETGKAIEKLTPERRAWILSPAFYKSREWEALRYRAIRKYGNKCACCNAEGVVIHMDHIKPRSKFPELALDIHNLQPLCGPCNRGKSNIDSTDWRKKKRPEVNENPWPANDATESAGDFFDRALAGIKLKG